MLIKIVRFSKVWPSRQQQEEKIEGTQGEIKTDRAVAAQREC